MKLPVIAAILTGALGVATAFAAPPTPALQPDELLPLFRPFQTDRACLSPDGKYLAYSMRQDDKLSVVVIDIDHPQKALTLATVATDETSTPMNSDNQAEKTPAQIRWMRWTTPTRLAVDTNAAFAVANGTAWTTHVGAVFALDADGQHAGLVATPRDLLEQIPNASTLVPADAPSSHTIWSPDQPVPSGDSTSFGDTTPDPSDPAVAPTLAPQAQPSTTVLAQDFHVVDLAPGKPGDILLQTEGTARDSGSRRVGFVLLDTVTGKMEDLSGDVVPPNSFDLPDLSAHVRLTLASTLLTPFPHAYEYLGDTGDDRPKKLDAIAHADPAADFTLSPGNFFGRRDIPIGFGSDPNTLYFASNAGRDTYGVYTLNLKTGARGPVALEDPNFDLVPALQSFGAGGELVLDRFHGGVAGVRYTGDFASTKWLYSSFQDIERRIESALPGESVRILEWDKQARRFLVLADAPGDAGGFYIFNRDTGQLSEFARRSPWIDGDHTNKSYPFGFRTADGFFVRGLMLVPNHPRVKPMPVIMLCPAMPWDRISPDFQSRAQALAQMGFMVVEYNGRGAWGFGLRQREALAPGYDLTQVSDLMATLDYVEKNFTVDSKRVAVLGENHGGFIALRALQLNPSRFRCAIAINTMVDVGNWLTTQRWSDNDVGPALTRAALGDDARLKAAPLASHPEQIHQPIMLLHYPGPDGAPRTFDYLAAKSFVSAVHRAGGDAEIDDLSTDYMRGLPKARSEVYAQIDSFLNLAVYDYDVKVGKVRERK